MRHFARLDLPPAYDIPGLVPSDVPPLHPLQRHDELIYPYPEYREERAWHFPGQIPV